MKWSGWDQLLIMWHAHTYSTFPCSTLTHRKQKNIVVAVCIKSSSIPRSGGRKRPGDGMKAVRTELFVHANTSTVVQTKPIRMRETCGIFSPWMPCFILNSSSKQSDLDASDHHDRIASEKSHDNSDIGTAKYEMYLYWEKKIQSWMYVENAKANE